VAPAVLRELDDEELDRIEKLCGEQIAAGLTVYAASREDDFQDQKQAREINTLRAVFGEKYPDRVRVVSIGPSVEDLLRDPKNPKWMKYSVEFCGGTHVKNTSEIEAFVLTSEEGVAKGVRRVVGISGKAARAAEAIGQQLLTEAKSLANQYRDRKGAGLDGDNAAKNLAKFQKKLTDAALPLRARKQIQNELIEIQKVMKDQAKESAAVSGDAALDVVKKLFESAQTIGGVTVVVGAVPPASPDALRGAIDWVRNKTESSAVLLGFASEGKVTLIAGMSKTAVDRGLRAGDVIKEICPLVGGNGGGRPDLAQGGGGDPSGLANALQQAKAWISGKLS
jgi:alanyl-tRNA synthetase